MDYNEFRKTVPSREASQLHLDIDPESQAPPRIYTNGPGAITQGLLYRVLASAGQSVVTLCSGFSSLSYLFKVVDRVGAGTRQHPVRILLGNDDIGADRIQDSMPSVEELREDVRDHYMREGISVLQYPGVIEFIRLLQSKRVVIRLLPSLHAKLYVGPTLAVLGSSNLSKSGMALQTEANIWFEPSQGDYREVKETVDDFWNRGTPANDYFEELLNSLVQYTGWQEVLARAAATVLEAKWLKGWDGLLDSARGAHLWPTQLQSVAQSLFILEHNDCLLIADPTGSGKTRTVAALHTALALRKFDTGTPGEVTSSVVCPPGVIDNWNRDLSSYLFEIVPRVVSQGLLSKYGRQVLSASPERLLDDHNLRLVQQALRDAEILYLDEAHNLYNHVSNRSAAIRMAHAQTRVLVTATPIGRSIHDVVPMIGLLDPNNLSDEAVETFRKAYNAKNRLWMDARSRRLLTDAISRVTVRHTISGLNEQIDHEPDAFRDDLGNLCRYPEVHHEIYSMSETDNDRALASDIRALAGDLLGLHMLPRNGNVSDPAYWGLKMARRQADPVGSRLASLTGLTNYQIASALRSSLPRLIELITGRSAALAEFGLSAKIVKSSARKAEEDDEETDILSSLARLERNGLSRVPEEIKDRVPAWLRGHDALLTAIASERETYDQILILARRLSTSRIDARVALVKHLVAIHGKILLFEDSIISLAYLERLMTEQGIPVQPLYRAQNRAKMARQHFGLASGARPGVGLASRALGEGLNLQRAQAVVFSHIPVVYRHAEQRVGRIVRMNSSFSTAYVFWPQDAPEFRVSTDIRLFRTASDIKATIGSNMELPEPFMMGSPGEEVDAERAVQIFKEQWDRFEAEETITDAFEPLRSLVYGDRAIIPREVYDQIRTTNESVFGSLRMSKFGVVESRSPFVFATVARDDRAPEFFLWVKETDAVYSRDLEALFDQLRRLVAHGRDNRRIPESLIPLTDMAYRRFREHRRDYLTHKQRRALDVLALYTEWYLKKSGVDQRSNEVESRLRTLSGIRQEGTYRGMDIDLRELAIAIGHEVLEPLRQRILNDPTRKKSNLLTYRDLLNPLKAEGISPEALKRVMESIKPEPDIGNRTVALLIGMSPSAPEHGDSSETDRQTSARS
jgi:hypothetical protein